MKFSLALWASNAFFLLVVRINWVIVRQLLSYACACFVGNHFSPCVALRLLSHIFFSSEIALTHHKQKSRECDGDDFHLNRPTTSTPFGPRRRQKSERECDLRTGRPFAWHFVPFPDKCRSDIVIGLSLVHSTIASLASEAAAREEAAHRIDVNCFYRFHFRPFFGSPKVSFSSIEWKRNATKLSSKSVRKCTCFFGAWALWINQRLE